jgi:hypothetical protein
MADRRERQGQATVRRAYIAAPVCRGDSATSAGNGGFEVREVDWIDPAPLDASVVAQLLQEAHDAVWKYDLRMEYDVDPDEEKL